MALGNGAHHSQTSAYAVKLALAVQALEHAKQARRLRRGKAGTVVLHVQRDLTARTALAVWRAWAACAGQIVLRACIACAGGIAASITGGVLSRLTVITPDVAVFPALSRMVRVALDTLRPSCVIIW